MTDYVTEEELMKLGVELLDRPSVQQPTFSMPVWSGGKKAGHNTIDLMIMPGQKQDPIRLNPKVVDALREAGMEEYEVDEILARAEAARILETMSGNIASACVNVVLGNMSNTLKHAQLKRLKRVTTEEVARLMAQMNDAIAHISKQEDRIEELEAQVKMDSNERQFSDLINALGDDVACRDDLEEMMCDEQPLSQEPSSPPPSSPPLTHAQAIALAFGEEMFTDGYFS